MRDGMWNGRASRRTQVSITKQASKASAGIGTTVEHPCRKRIEYTKSLQNPSPRADTAVRPYAEDSYSLAIFQRMMRPHNGPTNI